MIFLKSYFATRVPDAFNYLYGMQLTNQSSDLTTSYCFCSGNEKSIEEWVVSINNVSE